MNRKRFSKKKMQSLCGEIHSDDGVDPTEFFRPTRKSNSNHRKAQQLCHQVADTLSLVLSGEFGEELRDLRIVAVTPAPDASQLLVLIAPAIVGSNIDPDAVVAKLAVAIRQRHMWVPRRTHDPIAHMSGIGHDGSRPLWRRCRQRTSSKIIRVFARMDTSRT